MINYNFIQKILHQFILGNNFTKKSLYELEKIFFLKKEQNVIEKKHVFISSLPRSGTTILLERLYSSGEFISLTYNNMPFIMSPNISKFFIKKKNIKLERFHQDRINIDLSSPEAFDEAIFSMFSQSEIVNEMVNYISLVSNGARYLSKNNNFKRIDYIKKAFPNAIILSPIRHPLQHSFSLLSQHKNFINLQFKNKFIRDYMSYLNHFEFGIDHKPWNISDNYSNNLDLNYWLEQWLLFYQNAIDKFLNEKNILFFKYENLTDQNLLANISEKISLKKRSVLKFEIIEKKIDLNYDLKLLDRCIEVYNKIKI